MYKDIFVETIERLRKSHLGNKFLLGNPLRHIVCQNNKFPGYNLFQRRKFVALTGNVAWKVV